jgi:hypothetical protein
MYAISRTALRPTSRQMLIAGLPAVALVTVALAGTAVWPFARGGVNAALGVRLDDQGRPLSAEEFELDARPTLDFAGVSGMGSPVRVLKSFSIGTDGSVELTAPPGGGHPDGRANGGSDGDPGDGGPGGGGATDPSPTVEPSPTDVPSPTGEPSPSGDPSPTTEPSPTDDPPGPPWGSPGPPPDDPPGPPGGSPGPPPSTATPS